MRITHLLLLAVSISASTGPLQALEASDTMAAWQAATSDQKTKLMTELLKRDGREDATSSVLKCLDAAAGAPGHAELPIREILAACEKASGEPV